MKRNYIIKLKVDWKGYFKWDKVQFDERELQEFIWEIWEENFDYIEKPHSKKEQTEYKNKEQTTKSRNYKR